MADALARKPRTRNQLETRPSSRRAQGQAKRAGGGLGEEYRLSTTGQAGATLVAQERVANLLVFPVAEAPEAPAVNQ